MTTIDRQKFARAVKRYREEKDLTQKELADKLMTTTTTVARWELGMSVPKQDRMIREIKALGINW
jgi:transcriptional regulator with XRE-family HTH domain